MTANSCNLPFSGGPPEFFLTSAGSGAGASCGCDDGGDCSNICSGGLKGGLPPPGRNTGCMDVSNGITICACVWSWPAPQ